MLIVICLFKLVICVFIIDCLIIGIRIIVSSLLLMAVNIFVIFIDGIMTNEKADKQKF